MADMRSVSNVYGRSRSNRRSRLRRTASGTAGGRCWPPRWRAANVTALARSQITATGGQDRAATHRSSSIVLAAAQMTRGCESARTRIRYAASRRCNASGPLRFCSSRAVVPSSRSKASSLSHSGRSRLLARPRPSVVLPEPMCPTMTIWRRRASNGAPASVRPSGPTARRLANSNNLQTHPHAGCSQAGR